MVTTLFGERRSYRQLSRSRTTLLGSLSLWEGADHFVQIEVLAFSETHKRFYFEDIKALTLRRTSRGFWLHLLLGFLTVLGGAVAVWIFSAGYSPGGVVDWFIVAVPAAFALGWSVHTALGPTCACHVMTPVQNARLGALARTRSARKVLAHLARRAQTSQGGEVGVRAATAPSVVANVWQADSAVGESGYAESSEAGPTRLYPIVSFVCLLNAVFLFSLLLWDAYPLRALQVLFVVGLLALGITCAAGSRRRRGSDIASWFKGIGWSLFSVNGVVFLLWYGYGFYLAAATRSSVPGYELTYVQQMLQISPHGSRFWFWVVLVDCCFSMVVGLTGLFAVLRRRRAKGLTEP